MDTSGHAHTGDYLEQLVLESIEKIEDLYNCKVGSLVTDNAANMVLMRSRVAKSVHKVVSYGCAAHYLNLLAKDFNNPAATAHVERVVKYFRNNHFARAKLNELTKGQTLVLPLAIRWNTMCDCLEGYVKFWPQLVQVCEEFNEKIDHNIQDLVTSVIIKRNAEDLLKILKPIAVALTQAERNKATIADAVFIWKELETTLARVLNTA